MRNAHAGIPGLILLLLMPLGAVATASTNRTTVLLPGGTPLRVHLDTELSSVGSHPGDTFAFTVIDDVRSGDWLVIPAGAHGVGDVVAAEAAGSNGHPGKLAVQFDYVYAADGEKVRVAQTADTTEGEQRKGAASTATIASYAVLGPLGLFAHNWVKGRDATIAPSRTFSIVVESTVHVRTVSRLVSGDDFAH
jgi:hypothetical protein